MGKMIEKELCCLKMNDENARQIITLLKLGQSQKAHQRIDAILKTKEREIADFSITNNLANVSVKIEITTTEVICIFQAVSQDFDVEDEDIEEFIEALSPEFEEREVYSPYKVTVDDMRRTFKTHYQTFLDIADFYDRKYQNSSYLEQIENYINKY